MIRFSQQIISFIFLVIFIKTQTIQLVNNQNTILIAQNGVINSAFYDAHKELDCGMPQLYILLDNSHQTYIIRATSAFIYSVASKWEPINSTITQQTGNISIATINNLCNQYKDRHQINWIQIQTSMGVVQYLVNCDPGTFYKPIQWGLFLLIMFASLILTLSSIYSRAWSYGGVGYQITKKAIIIINLLLLIGIFLAYLATDLMSFVVKIIGSLLGAFGVTVCASQTIWLFNNKNFQKKVFKKIRIIDIISIFIGLLSIPAYWLSNGQWIINDIMAVCTLISLIKLIKIRSLSIAFYLTLSILILQIIVGVFVHYVFKLSYNNYIINYFQSPVMLVMPSITHELYRQCAWLPITSVLLPGLFLSYLRRFDKTRGTFLYLYFGLASFYVGSICWMLIDLQTIHSLPFAIISEPITILIVYIYSFRRNQFKTLWRGNFHDQQIEQSSYILHKQTQIIGNINPAPSAYVDLTNNLRISAATSISSQYENIKIDEGHIL